VSELDLDIARGLEHVHRPGDRVTVTFMGKTIAAEVWLASPNGVSLMLGFDAMLGGYVGTMPVVWMALAGEFRDLITRERVEIKPR